MRNAGRLLAVFIPMFVLGGCASLSDQDRAAIASANQNAAAAQQQSAEALKASQVAQQQSAAAAADAKSANEKADRMFQRSLQK